MLWVARLTFIALFSEGVLQDWAAVYMRQVVLVPVWIAAIAYAGYSSAMALGRFAGDRVLALIGERSLMRLSGGLIIVGLAAALLLPTPLFAIAGFAVAGLGNSNLVPILFSAAGRDPVLGPGPGIATVTTVWLLLWFSGRTGSDRPDVEIFWSFSRARRCSAPGSDYCCLRSGDYPVACCVPSKRLSRTGANHRLHRKNGSALSYPHLSNHPSFHSSIL